MEVENGEQSFNQKIDLPVFKENAVELFIKREDLIHPFVSGNKYRKLKYNLIEAKKMGCHTLLTFGGAYSNHIAATAFAASINGFKSIGIIRGDELKNKTGLNPTLAFAQQHGMRLAFVSREVYRHKEDEIFINKLSKEFGDFYLLPEGGTNALAVKGCEEILTAGDEVFDFICTSVGTGGTMAGLVNCSKNSQQVLGFQALKGSFLGAEIHKFVSKKNWKLFDAYTFGGYGKVSADLVGFINQFKNETGIPLDPIYTGKMMFGIINLVKKGYFNKGTKLLAIHTGGLQGIAGANERLKQRKEPLIHV